MALLICTNILLKSDNQDMDLSPSLHLNTGTIVDICNFEGYLELNPG